jgi:hypothetical protein
VVLGCSGKGPEVHSGADALRDSAPAIELGKDVEDSVSFNDGDRTDWKEFDVAAAGKIVLDVMWGNASARCGFRIYDDAGGEVARYDTIAPEPRKVHRWEAKKGGKYWVRFQCEDEGDYSAYLLKVTFVPAAVAGGGTGVGAADTGDGDDGDGDEGDGGGASVKGGGAESDAAAADLVGEIKAMKKAKKGGATLLTIDKGTAAKVTVGMKGEIMGLSDAEFTVTKVTVKTCTAETALDPKVIGSNLVVRFHKE